MSVKPHFFISERMIWEDRDILKTPEDIRKFAYYMDDVIESAIPTEDEQQYLDEILSNLKAFRECLCLNCVKQWLLSLLDASDVVAVEKKLEKMLDGKEEFMNIYKIIIFVVFSKKFTVANYASQNCENRCHFSINFKITQHVYVTTKMFQLTLVFEIYESSQKQFR